MKQLCTIPEGGSNGVFQVKSVMGWSEWDSMLNVRTSGVGLEKE